jgi:hypothetical protein
MRIPNNVSKEDFTPESYEMFQKSNMRMNAVSNLLNQNKLGENDYIKAFEIFEGSEIQKLFES